MSKGKCETCKFWVYFDVCDGDESATDGDGLGTCHRYPPANSPEAPPPDAMPLSPDKWHHPCTAGSDWCGEFQAKTVGATPPAPSED